jgi:hypothetical protein
MNTKTCEEKQDCLDGLYWYNNYETAHKDDEYNFLQRYTTTFTTETLIRNEKVKGYHPTELFNKVLFEITGETFNSNNWRKGDDEILVNCMDDIQKTYCICCHEIGTLYFIKHRKKDIQIGVGSECVKKIDVELAKQLTHELCSICNEKPLDLRTKLGKAGFCDYNCQHLNRIGNWDCKFKKHKGKSYNEIFEKDVGYLEWLYLNVEKLHPRIIEWIKVKLRITE